MNIIIPMNGSGQRFVDEGYDVPKPLIKIHGRPMIYWVIENLNVEADDNIVIIYNSQLEEYNFESVMRNHFDSLEFKFIPLKYQTRGAAETILCGLNNIEDTLLSDPCMLIDCDTIYFDDIISQYKKQLGNTIFYFNDEEQRPIYSYIQLNKNSEVTDIREKDKISNNANTGAYCFESGTLLKSYCQKLLNSCERSKNEFYISGVYKQMLADNKKICALEVEDFHCVGTPLQLQWFASYSKTDKPRRLCFDIDNTLVTYPTVKGDYTTVKPIPSTIGFLRFLKSLGHHIILYTARRMRTHNGNVGGVVADIGQITLNTLKEFNIPYDEIYFGKPYADCYIDDLAINPKKSLEKQLGFYKTEIEPREFHHIENTEKTVIKKGNLKGEAYWYNNVPKELNNYLPEIIEANADKIELERINGIAFSYLYVNNSLTKHNLENLLQSIEQIHSLYPDIATDNIYANYTQKLRTRYCDYDYGSFKNSYDIYKHLENKLNNYEQQNCGRNGIIHGDPVFTNVLLDTKNNIKLIDPRGQLGTQNSIYGDIFYDYAKIYQSLIGYDFILLEKDFNDRYMADLISHFEQHIRDSFGEEYVTHVRDITASLLFTLIPLHNNSKCELYYNLIQEII